MRGERVEKDILNLGRPTYILSQGKRIAFMQTMKKGMKSQKERERGSRMMSRLRREKKKVD